MKIHSLALVASLLGAWSSGALAVTQVAVVSYDTPNGNTGSYNYWDESYNGSGNSALDGAMLTGGTGDLTDGYVETSSWGPVEAPAGPGPYVGWYYYVTQDPILTFNFAGNPLIDTIKIQIDNSTGGGVYAPAEIRIDGVTTAFSLPGLGQVGWAEASGLNLSGSSHTIQFFQQSGTWTMSSEIQFFAADSAVPEPASWALMLGGFGLVGGAMRSRRRLAFA